VSEVNQHFWYLFTLLVYWGLNWWWIGMIQIGPFAVEPGTFQFLMVTQFLANVSECHSLLSCSRMKKCCNRKWWLTPTAEGRRGLLATTEWRWPFCAIWNFHFYAVFRMRELKRGVSKPRTKKTWPVVGSELSMISSWLCYSTDWATLSPPIRYTRNGKIRLVEFSIKNFQLIWTYGLATSLQYKAVSGLVSLHCNIINIVSLDYLQIQI